MNIPVARPSPDAGRFLGILAGRTIGPPPLVEYLVDELDRLAVLGGVDINILAKGTEEQVRRRVRRLMEICGGRGRFAVGSGNSIPSYIPVENYLALVDEANGMP